MVELPLALPALPKLVVVIVETLPVPAEFLQAVFVDVVDAALIPTLSVPATLSSDVSS